MQIVYFAYIFSLAIFAAILFQVAMAAGAPWGSLAMGGRYPGRFPTRIRIAAIVQALVLSLLAMVVLTKARVILTDFYEESTIGIWLVVAISVISLALNLATPSKFERILWAPIASLLVVSSLVIALE
ncbi:MAG: hypothetical protein ACI9FB_001856 [Candidatus Azotimanducaceae bacterium]|jgi:hypothetical protein